jgi:hypothetical protein
MELTKMINDTTPMRKQVISFAGYNTQEQIADGEMRSMKNLSSDSFPALTQRKARGLLAVRYYNAAGTEVFPENVIVHKGNIVAITDTDFYYGATTSTGVTTGNRISDMSTLIQSISGFDAATCNMIALNERIYLFPYNIYFNANYASADVNVCGQVGLSFASASECVEAQTKLHYAYDSAGLKEDNYVQFFCSTEAAAKTLYRKMTDYAGATVYCSFTYSGTAYANTCSFEGAKYIGASGSYYEVDMYFPSTAFQNRPDYTGDKTGDLYTLSGTTAWTMKTTGTMPKLDFVVERDNRLWGCSNADNTIYSSKLGTGMTWDDYSGSTTDSYAVTMTSDGDFTGICKYSTHIVFFKQDRLHKIYGSTPATYTLQTTEAYGVDTDAGKSVKQINGIVYYKSGIGIMAYDGSYPVKISGAFGDSQYTGGVAGIHKTKYYISLKDKGAADDYSSRYHLFVYDTDSKAWMVEDSSKLLNFFKVENDSYMIRQVMDASHPAGVNQIVQIDADIAADLIDSDESRIEWEAVLGPYDEYLEDHKIYSNLLMRMRLDIGSTLDAMLRVDGGEWIKIRSFYGDGKRSAVLPVTPRRCDNYEIKLSGRGRCVIKSIMRRYMEGSEY